MLAYLFHHWRRRDVAATDYDARLRRFHEALAAAPPRGYAGSHCLAHPGTPWANAGGEAYEDWYLIDDFADLAALNEAAVTASRQAPHDQAAAAAGGGTAGIYRSRLGTPRRPPTMGYWFAKPPAMSYTELDTLLRPFTEAGDVLWMRQMTLGPAREFCLHAGESQALPSSIDALPLVFRPIWPSA
jgi:hypothetical protein